MNITKREHEVVELLSQGLTARQIAEKLYLSVLTVENHKKNIMRKLNCHNSASIVSYYYQNIKQIL